MNGVVSSVHAGSLGVSCDAELVLASTLLSLDAGLKVALRVLQNVTKQLCELAGVLSLLKSVALVSLGNLWITFTVSLT